MHADPHPGNLMVTSDGDLTYLDFGMLVRVSPAHRLAMLSSFVHIMSADWDRLVVDLEALDLLKPETDRTRVAASLAENFARATTTTTDSQTRDVRPSDGDGDGDRSDGNGGGGGAGGEGEGEEGTGRIRRTSRRTSSRTSGTSVQVMDLNYSEVTLALGRTALEFKFLLPPYYTLVVRSLATLEGVALQVGVGVGVGVGEGESRATARAPT